MARSISQRYPSYLWAEPVCEYKASFKESSEAVRSPLLFFRTLLNHSVPAETNEQHSKPRGVRPLLSQAAPTPLSEKEACTG